MVEMVHPPPLARRFHPIQLANRVGICFSMRGCGLELKQRPDATMPPSSALPTCLFLLWWVSKLQLPCSKDLPLHVDAAGSAVECSRQGDLVEVKGNKASKRNHMFYLP